MLALVCAGPKPQRMQQRQSSSMTGPSLPQASNLCLMAPAKSHVYRLLDKLYWTSHLDCLQSFVYPLYHIDRGVNS